ncbi:serine/threonine protein kinase [Pseudanabaena sp. lw0831]|uniref:caspase, EACC1-associated type n=1 Tax=Pseudanabaena sp. lw0831 TaxID=1357935 RepID=UPI0019169087|nr:SUMF1/EgtB/PvdO family nonheme iron enzyme [Pseudanabaena sp. lw0831]GBO53292.1 serine/threonine protein kinase [Pseudanabaena sp. lw0831]
MAKKALLIGVSQYEAGLPPLAAAPKDVAAMLRVLQSPELGAFDDVKTLIDPDLEAMQTAIDLLFQSCQKGDLGLLYFSGHGITDDSDRLYLATRRTSKDTFKANSVPASFIQGIMRDHHYQRQQVLILDCCYSGAFAEGWLAKSVDINLKPQLEVEGSVVLTSSTATQKSYEDKEGELSLYTNYIVQGIESGAAESDGDGMISADELHEYAKRHVQSAKPAMKPEIYGIRQGIKILLSRARVDMKLEYRLLVEKYVENGDVSIVGQEILKLRRDQWRLTDEIAISIENEVLEPDRNRLRNLERYRKALKRAVQQQFPLPEKTNRDLKDLQEILGLRDEDIIDIQDAVTYPYAELKEGFIIDQTVTNPDEVHLDNGEFFANNVYSTKNFSYEVIEVNLKGLKISQQRKYAEYYREKLDEKTYLDMVLIRSTSHDVGDLSQNQGNKYHQNNTLIPSFWMSKYLVTQSQWKSVAKLPKIKYELELEPARFKGGSFPVERISWLEAEEFCERISKKTGKKYRLPSEFEWEYACRAGTKTPYHFGETITPDIANYRDKKKNSPEQTTLVGCYRVANAFGLFDMHGNVWEWCKDIWNVNQEFRNLTGESCYRVICGGSWFDDKHNCRSSSRRQAEQENKHDTLGFRVVMDTS